MSNRKQARLEAKRFIDTLSVEPYPNSQKSYLLGSRPDIRVPVREITLSDTLVGGSKDAPIFEPNEPICVYDTSGVYTDPSHDIDLYKGLPKLREEWIEERRDTHILPSMSSHFARERLADETLDELRYGHLPRIRRAIGKHRVTQLHYARRESLRRKWSLWRSVKTLVVLLIKIQAYFSSMLGRILALIYPI